MCPTHQQQSVDRQKIHELYYQLILFSALNVLISVSVRLFRRSVCVHSVYRFTLGCTDDVKSVSVQVFLNLNQQQYEVLSVELTCSPAGSWWSSSLDWSGRTRGRGGGSARGCWGCRRGHDGTERVGTGPAEGHTHKVCVHTENYNCLKTRV